MSLNVIVAHNYYRRTGGEDAIVAGEIGLLSKNACNVHLLSVTNDEINNSWARLKRGWQAPYSHREKKRMAKAINEFEPNVVHVHNFFPILTPSIYDACVDAGVPVVQTLHNYRTICPGALLMCAGQPYEACIRGSPYRAALHRCYRGSLLGSLAVARMVDIHRKRGTWQTKVDRFIAPTAFAKSKFVAGGFPADRIAVKPNFVEDRIPGASDAGPRKGALFVGRLSPEKGILTLLKAWTLSDAPLRIAGDGPLLNDVLGAGTPSVASLGRLSKEDVAAEMTRAAFLVMPSECYETFGIAIIEAYRECLPVIVSRLGAMAEIVEDGVTGLHFTPGDSQDLAAKVRWAVANPGEMRKMGRNARRVYEEKYTSAANYRQLMAIYEHAIEASQISRIDSNARVQS